MAVFRPFLCLGGSQIGSWAGLTNRSCSLGLWTDLLRGNPIWKGGEACGRLQNFTNYLEDLTKTHLDLDFPEFEAFS